MNILNSKTEKILDDILSNSDMCKEFLKMETLEEMYELFLKLDNDISIEEFDEFVSVALKNYEGDNKSGNFL